MRFIAYAFILAGLIYLADATYDQYRGIASVSSRSQVYVASRADKPMEFRSLMGYQWTRGSLALLAGLIILDICRRADRLDPFSPDLPHSDPLDDK